METEETNKICRKGEAVENLLADGITQLEDRVNLHAIYPESHRPVERV